MLNTIMTENSRRHTSDGFKKSSGKAIISSEQQKRASGAGRGQTDANVLENNQLSVGQATTKNDGVSMSIVPFKNSNESGIGLENLAGLLDPKNEAYGDTNRKTNETI